MGRVIIYFKDGTMTSMKCKSYKRAGEIAAKRPDTKSYTFYADNDIIPRMKKQPKKQQQMSLQEMEAIISRM